MQRKRILAAILSTILLGCGGEGSSENNDGNVGTTTPSTPPSWLPDNAPSSLTNEQQRSFIQRATAGASAHQIAEIERLGYINWMEQQFNLPTISHRQTLEAAMPSVDATVPPSNCGFIKPSMSAARDGIWWDQMLYGDDQLRQRATFALSQILVVSRRFSYIGRHPQSLAAYYDILQQHAFGNYRDLLEAVTLSPAMGSYLSMVNSKKHNPKRGTYPDENYAREVMQLFTIGLYQLEQDGSAKLDSMATQSIPTAKPT
ncbi:DUF1800 family protein [Enterovibrio coralii]|uniref:DUF1800 domain-containing protein n=1 Tax=Enterovibrio coralii TaxID=294935 RepID=A0A135ICT4_9GAMM|nr:DUF1800 family protein [Enterovibrio coralii]KXF83272.1 hypothetical protein ATN88_06215 [Enterovibrio coralii]